MSSITRPEAEALATLVTRLRANRNMPIWDHPGILAAIEKARGMADAFDLTHALLVLAERPELKTPALLPESGEHWRRASGVMVTRRGDNNIPCPDHIGETQPCRRCNEGKRPPTEDEKASLRALVEAARKQTEQRDREAQARMEKKR